MWKRIVVLVQLLLIIGLFVGCRVEDMEVEKLSELEFTVMKEVDLPEELAKMIDKKKEGTMKLTYSDGQYLYLVKGYGEQKTGGYSIVVEDLYLTKNAIYFNTNLLGPQTGEEKKKTPTYPFLVVKLEDRGLPVVFS